MTQERNAQRVQYGRLQIIIPDLRYDDVSDDDVPDLYEHRNGHDSD